MNLKKKFASGMNVGSSSILVTFVLLCLVTFAALSFVSANSERKLSLQAADRMTEYYNANHMAEVFLLNIDSQLKMLANNVSGADEFYDSIEETFSDNSSVIVENNDGTYTLSYSVTLSDTQKLCVKLEAVYPKDSNQDSFIIREWETISTYSEDNAPADDNIGFLF